MQIEIEENVRIAKCRLYDFKFLLSKLKEFEFASIIEQVVNGTKTKSHSNSDNFESNSTEPMES